MSNARGPMLLIILCTFGVSRRGRSLPLLPPALLMVHRPLPMVPWPRLWSPGPTCGPPNRRRRRFLWSPGPTHGPRRRRSYLWGPSAWRWRRPCCCGGGAAPAAHRSPAPSPRRAPAALAASPSNRQQPHSNRHIATDSSHIATDGSHIATDSSHIATDSSHIATDTTAT